MDEQHNAWLWQQIYDRDEKIRTLIRQLRFVSDKYETLRVKTFNIKKVNLDG